MSPEKLPPEPERPSTKAAERLAVIVDAAERAALSVIDDAEREAQRYLEEAKARADLIAAERLRETADELERKGGAVPAPAPAEAPRLKPVQASAQKAPPAAPAGEAEEEPPPKEDRNPIGEEEDEGSGPTFRGPTAVPTSAGEPPRQPGSAAARLLATQMAVSGSSRKEIEMRLRSGFEIEDTGEILDAILGPEE